MKKRGEVWRQEEGNKKSKREKRDRFFGAKLL